MARKAKRSRPRKIHVLVGTQKGGFRFTSDLRRRTWKVEGPFHPGWEVNHLMRDPRSGHLWAAINTSWWGNDLQVSRNGGKKWEKASSGLGFSPDRGLNLERIWYIAPDRASRSGTLWCGAAPGALFRTDDGGRNWYEVKGLTQHSSRDQWQPGAGGMMVHGIFPHPADVDVIYATLSVAGCFRSDDDGKTWQPRNRGVRADFAPKPFPEVGQCVHRLVMSPANPDRLYQQNHCGVYRSMDGGAKWEDISKGLPSRFGFPMAVLPNPKPEKKETLFVIPQVSDQFRYVCGGRLGVWRSKNGGDTWKRLTRGLPQQHVYTQVMRHALVADQCEKPGVYFGTTSGELYYSLDQGDSWKLLHAHLARILSVETAVV